MYTKVQCTERIYDRFECEPRLTEACAGIHGYTQTLWRKISQLSSQWTHSELLLLCILSLCPTVLTLHEIMKATLIRDIILKRKFLITITWTFFIDTGEWQDGSKPRKEIITHQFSHLLKWGEDAPVLLLCPLLLRGDGVLACERHCVEKLQRLQPFFLHADTTCRDQRGQCEKDLPEVRRQAALRHAV